MTAYNRPATGILYVDQPDDEHPCRACAAAFIGDGLPVEERIAEVSAAAAQVAREVGSSRRITMCDDHRDSFFAKLTAALVADGHDPSTFGPLPADLFPPDVACVCGCLGSEHAARWEGDTFKGTRCSVAEHGGHKFQAAVPA